MFGTGAANGSCRRASFCACAMTPHTGSLSRCPCDTFAGGREGRESGRISRRLGLTPCRRHTARLERHRSGGMGPSFSGESQAMAGLPDAAARIGDPRRKGPSKVLRNGLSKAPSRRRPARGAMPPDRAAAPQRAFAHLLPPSVPRQRLVILPMAGFPKAMKVQRHV